MFGKLFESMYDGTLCGHWQALITFQQMVILSEPDGTLDMTPQALAARTGIPLEIIDVGIEVLEQADPHSRSSVEEGKRIVRLDPERSWGWRVVNKEYYRRIASAEEKRQADRNRISEKRTNSRMSRPVAMRRDASREVADVAHADADADADADKNPPAPKGELPIGLDLEAWERWLEYRRLTRKPIKPASVQAAQRKLVAYGTNQSAAVEHSIASGYTGIYPPGKGQPSAAPFGNKAYGGYEF